MQKNNYFTLFILSIFFAASMNATVYNFPATPDFNISGNYVGDEGYDSVSGEYYDLTITVSEVGGCGGENASIYQEKLAVGGCGIGTGGGATKKLEIIKTNNSTFTLNSLKLIPFCYTPDGTNYQSATMTVKAFANNVEVGSWSAIGNHLVPINLDFSLIPDFVYIDIDKIELSAGMQDFYLDDLIIDAVSGPTITSATYNASSGALIVTGANIEEKAAVADIDATKFTITGQGGATRTLSTTSSVDRTDASTFTLTISGADKTAVDNILNKNGLSSVGGTTFNIAAAADWCTNFVGGEDLTGNGIDVSGVTATAVSSTSPADAATGVAINSAISVVFNIPMNSATLTAQTSTGAPSGSIQVSSDNFTNAIGMTSAVASMSNGNMTVTFTPATNLDMNTTYKIRVTTAATSANAIPLPAQYTSTTGFTTLNVANPSPFTATVNSNSQIDLSWTLNGNSNPVLVAFNTTSTFGNPVGAYSAGNSIDGGGTVLYAGGLTTYSHTSLNPNVRYYYKIWSKDGSDNYSSGLTDDDWTLANIPGTPTVDNPTLTTLNVSLDVNSNPAGTEFAIQETGGSGRFVQTNGTLGIDGGAAVWQTATLWNSPKTITGLTAGTTYTFKVKAKNALGTETNFSSTAQATTLSPEINIQGNNTSISDGDATPSALDDTQFGNCLITGATVVKTYTIENLGDGALVLSGIPLVAISGINAADFTVSQQPNTPIAATGTTTFEITFDPTTIGSKVATVSIANSDADEDPYTFAIQGNAINAPTTQASNIFFSNISRTGMTVGWTRGNGEGSLLLGKESAKISATPLLDGQVYNGANSIYTSAPTVGGAKLLYNGTAANPSVSVTGLTKYKLVYFKVCEYNNVLAPIYLQTENASNPSSRWTLRRDAFMEEDLSFDMEYAYPNPVSNSITTTLDLFEAGTVTAKLYDINGKLAADLYNQALPFGTHELKFDVSAIPSGVYQLIISKGSDAIVYPVSVVR